MAPRKVNYSTHIPLLAGRWLAEVVVRYAVVVDTVEFRFSPIPLPDRAPPTADPAFRVAVVVVGLDTAPDDDTLGEPSLFGTPRLTAGKASRALRFLAAAISA